MRYFGFLARFVIVPLAVLRVLLWWDRRRGRMMPAELTHWPEEKALLAHAVVAVAYTTIWDNYLVASKIWGYDRNLVAGIRLGWVPAEEYAFFVLQPLLTGSLLQVMARRIEADPPTGNAMRVERAGVTAGLGGAWALSLFGLARGGPRLRYMTLITSWALPPIMLQTAFGGDILWRHRKMIARTIISASLYLSAADSHAIEAGTWHISRKKTLGLNVIPKLPIEEFVFFCLTNTLLAFGVTLVLSKESEQRLSGFLRAPYARFRSRYLS